MGEQMKLVEQKTSTGYYLKICDKDGNEIIFNSGMNVETELVNRIHENIVKSLSDGNFIVHKFWKGKRLEVSDIVMKAIQDVFKKKKQESIPHY